jgi:hypothetical protein
MELDSAQVSSLTTSLGELVERVAGMAEGFDASPREDVAADLFEVERHLRTAHRRLAKLLDRMG